MSLTPEQCSFGASIAAHSMHAVHDSMDWLCSSWSQHEIAVHASLTGSVTGFHTIPEPLRTDLLLFLQMSSKERTGLIQRVHAANTAMGDLLAEIEARPALRLKLELLLLRDAQRGEMQSRSDSTSPDVINVLRSRLK